MPQGMRSGENREGKAAMGTSDSISTDAVCKDRAQVTTWPGRWWMVTEALAWWHGLSAV